MLDSNNSNCIHSQASHSHTAQTSTRAPSLTQELLLLLLLPPLSTQPNGGSSPMCIRMRNLEAAAAAAGTGKPHSANTGCTRMHTCICRLEAAAGGASATSIIQELLLPAPQNFTQPNTGWYRRTCTQRTCIRYLGAAAAAAGTASLPLVQQVPRCCQPTRHRQHPWHEQRQHRRV